MTTEFVLIRHGQTDWNTEGRLQGSSDTYLNEMGVLQVNALADAMRGQQWDVMASSPLQRTMATALPIAAAIGIDEGDIIRDERLIERHYGEAEGLILAERESRWPGEIWPGLESREDLAVRAVAAVKSYHEQFPNTRIVLISHGTWINAVLEVFSNGTFGHGKNVILNTSRSYITHDDQGWHVGDVSIATHLEKLV